MEGVFTGQCSRPREESRSVHFILNLNIILSSGELGQTYGSVSEEAELLEQKVYRAGSHVILFYKQRIAVSVAENPAFMNQAMTFHDVGYM